MKTNEIRPRTTYIGCDGLLRKVKHISMDIRGGLNVDWRGVKVPRDGSTPSSGSMSIKDFARWAISVQDTYSVDLEHYLPQK